MNYCSNNLFYNGKKAALIVFTAASLFVLSNQFGKMRFRFYCKCLFIL
jgi:hypothetical protein